MAGPKAQSPASDFRTGPSPPIGLASTAAPIAGSTQIPRAGPAETRNAVIKQPAAERRAAVESPHMKTRSPLCDRLKTRSRCHSRTSHYSLASPTFRIQTWVAPLAPTAAQAGPALVDVSTMISRGTPPSVSHHTWSRPRVLRNPGDSSMADATATASSQSDFVGDGGRGSGSTTDVSALAGSCPQTTHKARANTGTIEECRRLHRMFERDTQSSAMPVTMEAVHGTAFDAVVHQRDSAPGTSLR